MPRTQKEIEAEIKRLESELKAARKGAFPIEYEYCMHGENEDCDGDDERLFPDDGKAQDAFRHIGYEVVFVVELHADGKAYATHIKDGEERVALARRVQI